MQPQEQPSAKPETPLSDSEWDLIAMMAEAFSAGQLFKNDDQNGALGSLIRKGLVRTSGSYVTITDFGVDVLRERGYRGPLPVTRARR